MKKKISYLLGLFTLILLISGCSKPITNFEECVAAGNPVMESYPEKCRDPISDKTFTREIDDAWKLDGINLMQHETEGYYACFGCGSAGIGEPAICADPIAAMNVIQETESMYCNDKLEVVANEADGARTISDIRVIYTTEYVEDTSEYEIDCIQRGGYFKECGSACPTDKEECPAVCALTCEFEEPKEIKEEESKTFQEKLESIALDKNIRPIEGFDAYVLIQALPGLLEGDFHEVITLEGEYKIVDDKLTYVRTAGNPVTSAEQMITDEGYNTLLQHLKGRFQTDDEDLIIERIANAPDNKFCKEKYVLSVSECGNLISVVYSNPDKSSTYYRQDGTEIICNGEQEDNECEDITRLMISSVSCIQVC